MEDFARAEGLAPDITEVPLQGDRLRFGSMHSRRGWVYLLSARQLALKDFDAAIQIAPDVPDSYTGRGYVYVAAGEYRKAIVDAKQALQLAGDDANPGLLFNVACIYAQAAALAAADKAAGDDAQQLAEDCRTAAIDNLGRCLQQSAERRAFYLRQMKTDEALDPLRDDEPFRALLNTAPLDTIAP